MAVRNISLDGVNLNSPNRYLGGSESSQHPYIKGYFYVFFKFSQFVSENFKDIDNNGSNILLSLCEGFTPPGDRQIITEDVNGIGGLDASFVTRQQIDRNFSLMFRDIWGAPIFKIHRAISSYIDPYWGGVLSTKDNKYDFIPNEYKMKVLVVQTKPMALFAPDFDTSDLTKYIQKVYAFDGVVPLTDLNSVYDSNIADNTVVKPTIQYRFDGIPIDETYDTDVIKKAASALEKIAGKGKTVLAETFNEM